jgi:predicted ester cyclase
MTTDLAERLVERAMRLWTEPIPADDASALAAFATVYADPVVVNGARTPLPAIVDRARMMQGAFAGLGAEIQELVTTGDQVAFAFRLSGRHVGAFATPIGTAAATGHEFTVQAIDIFVLAADRVARIYAVADLLDLLRQADAVTLTTP